MASAVRVGQPAENIFTLHVFKFHVAGEAGLAPTLSNPPFSGTLLFESISIGILPPQMAP